MLFRSFAFRETMQRTFVDGIYGGKKSFSAVSDTALLPQPSAEAVFIFDSN